MGSCYQEMRLDGDLDRKAVEDRFRQEQEQDRYENGHSYSGGIGMATGLEFRPTACAGHARPFPHLSDATEWLEENAEKWEAALAVRAKDGRETLTQTTYPHPIVEHEPLKPVKTESPNPNFGKEFWVIGAVCSS